MPVVSKIAPCLWFDDQAEEAVAFYMSVFPDSKKVHLSRYPDVGQEIHKRPAGSVMTIEFELGGQKFTALNGGPLFHFNEALSLQIYCETQQEVDHYWDKLSEGGDPKAQACGWLKDKFGVSWQVVPTAMIEMMADTSTEKSKRAFKALLDMKKLDIAALQRAYEG